MVEIVAAVIVAGGRGTRSGGGVAKQYRPILGAPVLRRTLAAFVRHPRIQFVQPVIAAGDAALFAEASGDLTVASPVTGGITRQDSVRAGLEALAAAAPDLVLIHDAARPFVSPALIDRAIDSGLASGAAIPGLLPVDAVKTVDDGGVVTGGLDRAILRMVQTPQAFRYGAILSAHREAAAAGLTDFPDDAALAQWAGLPVTVFEGDPDNMKLTYPDDFARAEARALMALADVRTGSGFDVHAFADGDHVMLGGVAIPHDRGLSGHSDADVVLHAAVDAILGALADGDIGQHFPPSDPQWSGASSDRFLAFAMERVRQRGGMLAHLDVTVICEAPKVGPHREAIRTRIAEISGVPLHRIAVKATTSEKLGFTGRGEGIACMVTATVRLPVIVE
ncbi:MAG TPA: bifunctional 2-C-methyl-D-erythritol 4-phosphate cytidylyltransferase/2-C-methyl-D-erythritol 2,4-cyclodiphosphate synthase [Xanthobacteraceae bacterium]|nr:bifunctional 2-C-methyl-D-erythritol 4-phosphate cytidylyltransferase/2-C-methyl-D-erythritol 2,4-cyclodiphosphate synthase [Xanthobacteraceae bacterium]